MKAFSDFLSVFPSAFIGAVTIAHFVEFILGMCGYGWSPVLHLNFVNLLLYAYWMLTFIWDTSPYTDPSKGFTGLFEGSCDLFDLTLSKDDIMAMFDGRNPVLAVSAVMLCIVSLVRPPPCVSRWVWVLAWLALAVTLSPFRIEELIAHIMGPVPLQCNDDLISIDDHFK